MTNIELRQRDDGTVRLTGYASVSEHPYEVGWFTETISRGAFKRSLSNPSLDVKLLVNHAGLPLADTKTKTLRLREDDRGLLAEADLDPGDPDAAALVAKMRRGLVNEMSMGFRAVKQQWSEDHTQRRVTVVEMHRGDVSAVSYGANPATSTSLRSQAAGMSLDIPREERARRARMIGDRLTGATGAVLLREAASDASCNRCGGDGTITITCPTCSASEEPDGADDRSAKGRPILIPGRNYNRLRLEVARLRGANYGRTR